LEAWASLRVGGRCSFQPEVDAVQSDEDADQSVLNVSDTGLTDLPKPLGRLSKLKAIVAMNNPWSRLDEEVVAGWKELNSLSGFDLLPYSPPITSHCCVPFFPICLCRGGPAYPILPLALANSSRSLTPSHLPLSQSHHHPLVPINPRPHFQAHILALSKTHRCFTA
jgi:Leucine-rich repeat (LRR) protein